MKRIKLIAVVAVSCSALLGYVKGRTSAATQYKTGFYHGVTAGAHAVHVAQTQYQMRNLPAGIDYNEAWLAKDAKRYHDIFEHAWCSDWKKIE
jgi:hypothetical protein